MVNAPSGVGFWVEAKYPVDPAVESFSKPLFSELYDRFARIHQQRPASRSSERWQSLRELVTAAAEFSADTEPTAVRRVASEFRTWERYFESRGRHRACLVIANPHEERSEALAHRIAHFAASLDEITDIQERESLLKEFESILELWKRKRR